jgi:hypothetical protein
VSDEASPTPSRGEVVAVLKAHGAAGAAAAAAWAAARRLVAATRRRGVEHAARLDASSGVPVGPTLSGAADSTDLRPHLARLAPNRSYIVLHTHPMNQSFSALDVLVLATQPRVGVLVAVGIDGKWHVASRTGVGAGEDRRAAFDAYIDAFRRAAAEGTAWPERAHVAMQALDALGLIRYHRAAGDSDD